MADSPYYKLLKRGVAWVVELRLSEDVDTDAFNDITAHLVEGWPMGEGSRVLIDLSQNRYLGSMLLGLMVNLRQKSNATGSTIVFAGVNAPLQANIRVTNLERLLKLAPSREAGLKLLGK